MTQNTADNIDPALLEQVRAAVGTFGDVRTARNPRARGYRQPRAAARYDIERGPGGAAAHRLHSAPCARAAEPTEPGDRRERRRVYHVHQLLTEPRDAPHSSR